MPGYILTCETNREEQCLNEHLAGEFHLGGLKNLLYNGAGAECNGAATFLSVKDSGVLTFCENQTKFSLIPYNQNIRYLLQ